jgi:hypothetical protein
MNKSHIVMGITARVASFGTPYDSWRIGLTHNAEALKTRLATNEDKDLARWTQWPADSLADAQEIENHFIEDRGMKRGAFVDLYDSKPVVVYVF